MTTPAFRWPLRIQFVDTDASGRIHYTATLRHFETAEVEFMRHIGCQYNHMEAQRALSAPPDGPETGGLPPRTAAPFYASSQEERDTAYPRVHVECDYIGSLTYEDMVEIGVSVLRIGGKAFTLGFQVFHKGSVAARGNIVIAAMDRQTGKSKPLPEALVQCLRPYMAPTEP